MSRKQKKKQLSIRTKTIIFLTICFFVCLSFVFEHQLERLINYAYNPTISSEVSDSELKVHFIDVGQGDSIAIELPDGKNILIDAGTGPAKKQLIDYLNNSFFSAGEPKVFDYFIITHAHEDHIGCAPEVFANFEIKATYRPKVYASGIETEINNWETCSTNIYKNTIRALKNEKYNDNLSCEILYNDASNSITGSGYVIDFLSPNLETYTNTNNYSPILLLTYDNRKIILTGDAETLIEEEVLSSYVGSLKTDILKLGHHGSSTSTSNDFLNATDPEFVVISCGAGNKYRHPSASTLTKLSKHNIGDNRIYRTDLSGNIVFGVKNNASGDGIVSCSVNYTNTATVYISYSYFAYVVIITSALIIFIPKLDRKKLKKLIK